MSDQKSSNDVAITTKIYPMNYKNRKGFRIGNMKIDFDTKNAPFTSTDQIDHYLNGLFSYIKWASTKKDQKDETIEDKKKSIHDFLKAKKIEHIFSPKVVIDNEKKGAGRKKTKKTMKRKGGKGKTNKRKTYRHKGGNTKAELEKYIKVTIEEGLVDQFEKAFKKHPESKGYVLEVLKNMDEDTQEEFKNIMSEM